MTMNATQMKYAMGRVDAAVRRKKAAITEAHKKAPENTPENRAKQIRSGEVTLRKDIKAITNYTSVLDAFDFSKYEGSPSQHARKLEQRLETVDREANTLRDQIVLGDEEVALAHLRAFDGAVSK